MHKVQEILESQYKIARIKSDNIKIMIKEEVYDIESDAQVY